MTCEKAGNVDDQGDSMRTGALLLSRLKSLETLPSVRGLFSAG